MLIQADSLVRLSRGQMMRVQHLNQCPRVRVYSTKQFITVQARVLQRMSF